MKKFSFRLESVLRYRETQTRQREAELQMLLANRVLLVAQLKEVLAQREEAEQTGRTDGVTGAALQLLRNFMEGSRVREQRVLAQIAAVDKECEAARKRHQKARSDEKLLGTLRSKSMETWRIESLREGELLAGESFLAGLYRREQRRSEE
ncbi:hypothetical protein [uncultured Paludibaculum sp.]|uniref:hypothetical protein n=1 Tax=uncultured Paludibaculum sp. TaxID=1765020 RepID=UPI002AABD1FD|nr:hypothetical protein [uncultured Paludibaculum sp.]